MDEWISAAILTIIWFGIWLVTVWWAYRLGKSDGYTKACILIRDFIAIHLANPGLTQVNPATDPG